MSEPCNGEALANRRSTAVVVRLVLGGGDVWRLPTVELRGEPAQTAQPAPDSSGACGGVDERRDMSREDLLETIAEPATRVQRERGVIGCGLEVVPLVHDPGERVVSTHDLGFIVPAARCGKCKRLLRSGLAVLQSPSHRFEESEPCEAPERHRVCSLFLRELERLLQVFFCLLEICIFKLSGRQGV